MEIPRQTRRILLLFIALLIALYSMLVFRTGWLCDDAYITFRTIDNFINGYGLRWNVIERVQSFTHPLWMFLLAGFYAITKEIYYTSLLTSIVISIVTAVILVWRVTGVRYHAIVGLLVLIFSKAYMDFSTSGLENPLIHLLIVVFGIVYIREEWSRKKVFLLFFIASLGMVTRMDTALIFGPVLLYVLWKERNPRNYGMAILGSLPFILWEVFSVVYYGFPFPNTAYAKLNTGISGSELWAQGFRYFLNSMMNDPITLVVICCGMVFPLIVKRKDYIFLSAGVLLYCIYVGKIGGDFMSGRFFTPPLIASVVILMGIGTESLKVVVASCVVVITLGIIAPYPTRMSTIDYCFMTNDEMEAMQIIDERSVYYSWTSLEKNLHEHILHPSAYTGMNIRQSGKKLVRGDGVGFYGFYAGLSVHVLDNYALSDPLLSRLPVDQKCRIGHFRRTIPEGYAESILDSTIHINDSALAEYYRKIRLITRGRIFDTERLITILECNVGKYDHLRNNYISNLNRRSEGSFFR
jgi:arabinofuranosyltransferase